MSMQQQSLFKDWKQFGRAAIVLSLFPGALIIAPVLLASIGFFLAIDPIQAYLGYWTIAAYFAVLLVAVFLLGEPLIAPLWGIYYLRRIGDDFGPKTRDMVWELLGDENAELPTVINLWAIAREVGEQPKE